MWVTIRIQSGTSGEQVFTLPIANGTGSRTMSGFFPILKILYLQ